MLLQQIVVRPRYNFDLGRLVVFSPRQGGGASQVEEVWVSEFLALLRGRVLGRVETVGFMVDMPREVCMHHKLNPADLDLADLLEALRKIHGDKERASQGLASALGVVSALPQWAQKVALD